jgi:hypothetical protein
MENNGLIRWIDGLRSRLDDGELAALGPLDLGDGTADRPGETVVRVLLADFDHLKRLPDDALDALDVPSRRAELLDDFARLRALAGRSALRGRCRHVGAR